MKHPKPREETDRPPSRLDALPPSRMDKLFDRLRDDSPAVEVVLLRISGEIDWAPRDKLEAIIVDLIEAQDRGVIIDREVPAEIAAGGVLPLRPSPAQKVGIGHLLANALSIYGDYFRDGITYYAENGQAKRRVGP